MSNWIDLTERKPEEMRAVFVRGRPFGNKGEMKAVAVMDSNGDFYAVDTLFGWVESYAEAEENRMYDIEYITHWAPLPDFMYV